MSGFSKAPVHLRNFLENIQEVSSLLDHHERIAGTGVGRKYDVEVINKSAIVLVVACWEAYVEDVASGALEHLISHGENYSVFPKNVLEIVGSKHSGVNAWDLAGDGWKKALKSNFQDVFNKTIGKLNTPRAKEVDELFKKTIGIENLSTYWAWPGRSSSQAISALDKLITMRCEIAHRVKHSKSVLKRDVIKAMDLVSRLSVKTNNNVGPYIQNKTGKSAWGVFVFNGMR